MTEEEYLKPIEIAKKLNVSRFAIYKWIREGRLEGVYFGDDVLRVPRSSFDAFMQQSREKSEATKAKHAKKAQGAGAEEIEGNQKPTSVAA